jgi:hypothetical protein
MIRIQLLPSTDPEFHARVLEAIRRVSGTNGYDGTGPILADGEAALRRALSFVRVKYPDVWIRRQDPLASVDGRETWYAFRDEAVGAAVGRAVRR